MLQPLSATDGGPGAILAHHAGAFGGSIFAPGNKLDIHFMYFSSLDTKMNIDDKFEYQ